MAIAGLAEDAEVLSRMGFAYMVRGDFEEGIRLCERASRLDPRSGDRLYTMNIGVSYLRQYERHMEISDRILVLQPDHPHVEITRAQNIAEWKGYEAADGLVPVEKGGWYFANNSIYQAEMDDDKHPKKLVQTMVMPRDAGRPLVCSAYTNNAKQKRRGRIVTCGATTGAKVEVVLPHLFIKNQTILGSTMGPRSAFPEIFAKIADGTFRPVVDRVLPLSEVRRAHELLESREVVGKLVLVPGR